jgi:hypothetical protein
MDARDLELRNLTYRRFVELGRAPAADELGLPREEVLAGWRRLHDEHALILDRDEIRMANPFSAVPTRYRVQAGGRSWFANCAWDAFGICVVLGGDGRIEVDGDDPIAVEVRGARPDDESLLFHCLVPAAHWWDDIVYT